MSKRIVLITGANKGLGYETALQLGREGHDVIVGARDAAKGADAIERLTKAGGVKTAYPLTLDVTNEGSIARAVKQVEGQFGKVDSLINNAGVALEGWGTVTSQVPLEVWRKVYDTNVFGVVAVTQAFLPLVRKSEAGRIVNLSSILGSLTLHADPQSFVYNFKSPAYDSSKSALNQYTIHLAFELRDTPIKVNSAHPGWVKTDLGGEGATMELPEGARTTVWLATLPPDGPSGGFFHMRERLPW